MADSGFLGNTARMSPRKRGGRNARDGGLRGPWTDQVAMVGNRGVGTGLPFTDFTSHEKSKEPPI